MTIAEERQDTLSVGMVGAIAIIAIALLAIGITPGVIGDENIGGKASGYEKRCVPVGPQADVRGLDFNHDGSLDFYDYSDVLDGRADCSSQDCDLNENGIIDVQDKAAFDMMVRRVFDYDGDRALTRHDPLFLRDVLYGEANCGRDFICDLDGDGFVCAEDLTLYTSLVYNYENPIIK